MTELFDDLFVFEMANNHQGSVPHGLRIIEAMGRVAAAHGIRGAVKIQLRDLDTFIHPDWKGREDVKHIPRFESTRLSRSEFRQLVDATRAAGLHTVATPFDEASVDACLDLDVEILKVASCSARDWPLLAAVARADRPVIASTGGLDLAEIDRLVSYLRKRVPALALMHCVSLYPTPPEACALGFVERLARRHPGVTVGYSGHESPEDTDVVTIAVAKGARVLERHVGVPIEGSPLNAYSMDPEQTDRWVRAALRARILAGDGTKEVGTPELEALRSLERGAFARRRIAKGERIGPDDVFFAMPCAAGQVTSGEFGRLRSHFTASRDYAAQDPIHEPVPEDPMRRVRDFVHQAKGMLHEAGVRLGDELTVELSHHHGLEAFDRVGCVLVNLVNREYCQKVLIQLPGQSHPRHRHRRKEETFQVLAGDIEVELEGEVHALGPGDRLLVERGAWHSFRTRGGAIVTEVSTTHVVGDSEYEDPAIAELDPIQRKTILERW